MKKIILLLMLILSVQSAKAADFKFAFGFGTESSGLFELGYVFDFGLDVRIGGSVPLIAPIEADEHNTEYDPHIDRQKFLDDGRSSFDLILGYHHESNIFIAGTIGIAKKKSYYDIYLKNTAPFDRSYYKTFKKNGSEINYGVEIGYRLSKKIIKPSMDLSLFYTRVSGFGVKIAIIFNPFSKEK